jgi:hypothetical protein
MLIRRCPTSSPASWRANSWVNLTDLFLKVLEVLVEAFENRDQPGRQFLQSEYGRQTCDGSLAHR